MITLLEVFNKHFKDVKFDSKIAKSIYQYHVMYMNSNREYLEFFGSNLLGVHVIRFKDSDLNRFFDIFDVDYSELSVDIRKVKVIDPNFKVSSDVLNLTTMYLIHRFMTSPILNDNVKYRACYDVAVVFFMRTVAAILSAWIRYPWDPKVAQQAYANLSYKYLIKKLGSWHKVIDYRAEKLVERNGLHYKTLFRFDNEIDIIKTINDSAGRIQDIIKNYYSELVKANDSGTKIGSSSSTMLDIEGEEVVKERTQSVESYSTYITSIIMDEHSFIKDEYINVIFKINGNTSPRMIRSVLEWMSEFYGHQKYHKLIDEFITKLVIHTFFILNDNRNRPNLKDYPTLLVSLKNSLISTRSTDEDLMRIRELGNEIIKSSQHNTHISEALVLSTRTALMLYIVLRMLVGKQTR